MIENAKAQHLKKGEAAEQLAASTVSAAGYKLISQNFHSKYGELDLICRNSKVLVFIEVRFRSNKSFGSAAASVTTSKQKKLTKAAQYFIMQHPELSKLFMRFDVIGIDEKNQIQWIEGAFLAAV